MATTATRSDFFRDFREVISRAQTDFMISVILQEEGLKAGERIGEKAESEIGVEKDLSGENL